MAFNSITFLLFFTAVFALHSLPLRWKVRKTNLLLASYLFYAAWNPPFVALIWISTAVDWLAARAIARTRSSAGRRGWLAFSLTTNLGLLGFFKYGDFLMENFRVLLAAGGVDYSPPAMGIVLPVGISFYTFQSLSYTIDVYRGRTRPSHYLLDFALFVTFFPQLVAGPIVRSVDFLPQCVQPRRASAQQLGWGLALLVTGLFEKVVLADGVMAPVADRVYGAVPQAGFVDAWIGTIAFSSQIFFDFAGYSTCAIGAGLCLGFVLPDNFRFPYAAVGFSDFWRRWHISLSSWLRDYLYISLGGNRKGVARTRINLMLTMLLGGLWHGASWRFVFWGGLHGLYLAAERAARRRWGSAAWARHPAARLGMAVGTYALVCVAWVFFRAESFGDAFALSRALFAGSGGDITIGHGAALAVLSVTATLLAGQWALRNHVLEDLWRVAPGWSRSLALVAMILCIVLLPGEDRAFIYFRF
jgi:alginate O-acetyltransferase complex protein AlgI